MKTHLKHDGANSFMPSAAKWAPQLNLAEAEFHEAVAAIEERILHHCDRPEVEVRLLNFIARANGPTTDGLATSLGISRAAAVVHLRELRKANRVWGQPVRGVSRAWHITQAGRRFLAEKGSDCPD